MKRNKNNTYVIERNVFMAIAIVIQLFCSNNIMAQNEARVIPVPVQMGTVAMTNGKATVKLNGEVLKELKNQASNSDYYVFLTANGSGNIPLTLSEKGNMGFTVETSSGTEHASEIVKIDYIIYVNREVATEPALPRTSAAWKAEDQQSNFVKAGTGH